MPAFARVPLIYGLWAVDRGLWTVEWGPDGSVERWGEVGGEGEMKKKRRGEGWLFLLGARGARGRMGSPGR